MTIKRVVAGSGLTKKELAVLYGVSRQTIHSWAEGTSPPREGSLLARQAEAITLALLNLISNGGLPFPAMMKEARKARVERMSKTLQALRPASVKI
jgi:DNA-binding XRE family transcriptional regulator